MKKIIYIFIGCLLLTSCSGMLDIESHSAVSPGSVTPQDLSALRMGMYNKVQNSPTRESYITFDILGGDLTQSTGNAKDLINSVLSSLNSIVSSSWNGYYNALYQVNNVLSIVESLPESELRNLIIGEAHYFRAYIYHALVTRWGGVPIQKVNTMEKPFRDSEEAVWSFIEEELQTALAFLGTSSSYYYVSRDAALALKARVMLERGNLTEAATLAEGLITDGKYKLDSFDKIFRGKSNTEVIFSFQCLAEESNITISTLFYTYAHPNHGSYVYRPTNEVMNMYDDKDKRKEVSIINVGSEPCINKYPSGQTGTDPIVMSRLAEMYLISAEAQGFPKGLGRLNDLRKERGLESVDPKDKDEFLQCVLDERRKELLAEGFRYYDLIRTNTAKTTLGLKDYQHVLPIPVKEMISNPNMEPNPGY